MELAQEAGLDVGRGIVVVAHRATSAPAIFAGDAAEHQGRIYGIIPAAFDQARAAAFNILGQDKAYGGTMPVHTLKVAGIDLTSVGEIDAEEGIEEINRSQTRSRALQEDRPRQGRRVGGIWLGTKKGAAELSRLVAVERHVEALKKDLLEDGFNFVEIL